IEAYGTGILKINESYDEYDRKPIIETTGNAFKITLPNTNFHYENQIPRNTGKNIGTTSTDKKEGRINAVLALCRSNGSVIRTEVEDSLGISQSTAILLLRELVADGILIRKGKGKNLRYFENK
ncbi:MAG: AAA family ATPase, partial [Firmicutes bacterium]|nr:AAA family ATPase [Bacillota bacterium]